jgi:spore maturation protein A
MNFLFLSIFVLSSLLLLFSSPDSILTALIDGSTAAGAVCVSLVATYAVWMGLIQVWEDSGVSKMIAKCIKPLVKKLFRTKDEETLKAICMNTAVNLLGIGGAATPYGIKAARLLDGSMTAERDSATLLVLNATSLQLLPTSIVSMRSAMQSAAPADIILPTFLTTLVSTLVGVVLTRLFIKENNGRILGNFSKSRGQG